MKHVALIPLLILLAQAAPGTVCTSADYLRAQREAQLLRHTVRKLEQAGRPVDPALTERLRAAETREQQAEAACPAEDRR